MPILMEINDKNEMERKILAKNYSWLSLDENDIEKKIEYNEKALRYYPSYIPPHYWLGKWYSIRGYVKFLNDGQLYKDDKERAEQYFENGLECKKRFQRTNHNLFNEWGSHYYRWGDYKNAIEKFVEGIKEIRKYPNYESKNNNLRNIFSARISIINCLCKSGNNPDELIQKLENLLQENPSHPYVYVTLGVLNCKKGEYQDALNNFDKSIEIKPDNYYPYWHKARVLLRTNKREEAQSCFNKAYEIILSSPNEINKIRLTRWGQQNKLLEENLQE